MSTYKLLDTAELEPKERFDFWRDVVCDAYIPIDCTSEAGAAFNGRIELERFSKLTLSRITGSPQNVGRRGHHIQPNEPGYFLASLQVGHDSTVRQGERVARLKAGDFTLYSSTEAYDIICSAPVDQLIIQIPKSELLLRVPHAEAITACVMGQSSPMGRMAFSHLIEYARQIGTQPDHVQHLMQHAMLDILAASLAASSPGRIELSSPRQVALERVRYFIQTHLREDALTREWVADALGMSGRTLARLFSDQDETVSAFIRNARLDRVADDLLNPLMARQSISVIAAQWGLGNFQHFTKMFKDRFGVPPRDYRRNPLT